MVAVADFVIGGHTLESAYQFGEIRDLALFHDYRLLVADRLMRRVAMFSASGQFVTDVGTPGDGPGEFRSYPRSITVSPNDEIWVEVLYGFHVFSSMSQGWSYDRTVRAGPRRQVRGKAMFAGDGAVGLRIPGMHGELVWVTEGGVVREDTLPRVVPWAEMGYGEFFARTGDGRQIRQELRGPYHPKDLLRLGRTGGYARVVTSRYEIEVFGDDGIRVATISRQHAGPTVSVTERRREEHILDSLITFYGRRGSSYPEFVVPERKPPIEDLWYDEENRLWVQLSTAEADSFARAHVYTKLGEFLFAGAWPRDVSLEHGAIRGRAAIGVRIGVLDVPEIVRMTFAVRRPRDAQLSPPLPGED